MRAIQIAVGIHHLGLHPESEIHLQRVHVIDQALQALRKFRGIDGPIAQPRAIVIARAEPAIVHHEQLHPEFRRLVRQVLLPLLIDAERGGLPRIVEHRPQARTGAARQNLLAREAMQHTRRRAESGGRIPAIERRRLQALAGLQRVAEIEAVHAAGDAHLPVGRLLDRHAPVAAPAQRAEPYRAVLLAGVAGIDREPRIEIMAGVPLPALDHFLAFVDGLVIDLGFGSPAPAQIGELIALARRQIPSGRLRALHRQHLRRGVAHGGIAAKDAVLRIDAVVQRHLDRVVHVLQHDVQFVAVDFVRYVAQHQVAHRVSARDLQRRLVIARTAPAGKFLGLHHLPRVEARHVTAPRRRRQIVDAPQRRAPIEVAQRAIGAHAHGVRTL